MEDGTDSFHAATIKLTGARTGLSNFKLWFSNDISFGGDTNIGATAATDPGDGNSVPFLRFCADNGSQQNLLHLCHGRCCGNALAWFRPSCTGTLQFIATEPAPSGNILSTARWISPWRSRGSVWNRNGSTKKAGRLFQNFRLLIVPNRIRRLRDPGLGSFHVAKGQFMILQMLGHAMRHWTRRLPGSSHHGFRCEAKDFPTEVESS